jgi:hypothetical protein
MSVSSSTTTPPPSPTPSSADSPASSTQRTDGREQPAFKPNKDGDAVAAAQKSDRPPLPPGQGTRVDVLV